MSRKNIVLSIIAFVLLFTVTLTLGRYAITSDTEHGAAQGANFVFKTNYEENEKSDPYYVYDGEISIDIMNFDGVNQSYKGMEISYTVSVYPDATVTDSGSFKLAKGGKSTNKVSITDLTEGAYKVVITSTSPYSETITLYFYAKDTEVAAYYTLTEHTYWTQVDIYTGYSVSDISLTYTGVPDNGTELMKEWMSNTTSTFTPEAYTHYKLIFFDLESISIFQDGAKLPQK